MTKSVPIQIFLEQLERKMIVSSSVLFEQQSSIKPILIDTHKKLQKCTNVTLFCT